MAYHDDEDDDRDLPDPADTDDGDDDQDLLTPCPNCRRMVYDDVEQCPHCGEYITPAAGSTHAPWVIMTAIVCLVVAILLVLG